MYGLLKELWLAQSMLLVVDGRAVRACGQPAAVVREPCDRGNTVGVVYVSGGR